ncbi:MAG: dTDP-glucose 4,6-dehydratase [Candidatus Omnitrophica bacterium]|nr:dTDP-glucose 4,6-dehydratase [Candidatus Omnitrophota bacterium]
MKKILVTGGCGFIGSAFVRLTVQRGFKIVVVDCLDYAGDFERICQVKSRICFYKTDICNRSKIESIFRKEKPSLVINFAAQTHVDRSIKDPLVFTNTNVVGTQVLLDTCRKINTLERFVQISTDEVYGDILEGEFNETFALNPSSPYSASKASADLLIKAYIRTFQIPAIIIRPCNNYGPWQYPEKFIPRAILYLMLNRKVQVYAQGKNIREWLFVDDCAEGILEIALKAKIGEVYNLGSGFEAQNIEVVRKILSLMDKDQSDIEFVRDRPGHDFRYKLNTDKVRREIGWQAKVSFEDGLKQTIIWCKEHKNWLVKKYQNIERFYQRCYGR